LIKLSTSWNEGKIVGPKPPFELHENWEVRMRSQLDGRLRDHALFNLAIDRLQTATNFDSNCIAFSESFCGEPDAIGRGTLRGRAKEKSSERWHERCCITMLGSKGLFALLHATYMAWEEIYPFIRGRMARTSSAVGPSQSGQPDPLLSAWRMTRER
jgi:hypothetical protein